MDAVSRRSVLAGGIAGGLGLTLVPSRAFAQGAPVVTAPSGIFEGDAVGGAWRFRGIRYGSGPRFRAPVPFATPGLRRPAHEFGPVCPQRGPYRPCLLYTSPSPRDRQKSRMPSSA